MLGYVRAYKPELKFKEYDIYKGFYCTLCKTLMKRYSPLSQLFLSYDAVFFGLLLASVSDACLEYKKSRCCYNPMKKCMSCGANSELMKFCADISVILFFYKIKDNIADKGIIKKLLAILIYPVAVLMHKKAKKLQPQAETVIQNAMLEQEKAEKAGVSLDASADPSAKALSKLASFYTGLDESDAVCKTAYLVGRFVYCIDCIDDIEDDVKKKNFNPLKSRFKENAEDFYTDALGILNLNIAQIMETYDTISFKRYSEIIFNVLFDGLYNSALLVIKKHTKNQEVGE